MIDIQPYIVFNTFGILMLIISNVINNVRFTKKINALINNLNNLKMQTQQDFDAVIGRIDAATTHIASQVKDIIIPEIQAQGLPEKAEASILGKLTDLAGRLESVGQSLDSPLPGVVGSSTPVPLGEMPQEANTAPTSEDNAGSDTNTQPTVSEANTGQNTPVSDGAEVDTSKVNATMNPFPQPVQTLPGDTQTEIGANADSVQVGKQADANNGDTQTDANKDSNPANDEATASANITANAVPATESTTVKTNAAKKATGVKDK